MEDSVSFLLKRLREPFAKDFVSHGPVLNRRHFLITSTAAGVLSASPPMMSTPSVRTRGHSIVLDYRGLSWEIAPGLFGASATPFWKWRSSDSLELGLTHATLPGTSIDASFVAMVERRAGSWVLSLSIPGLNFLGEAPLLEWLADSRSLRGGYAGRGFSIGAVPVQFEGAEVELNVARPYCLTFLAERISFAHDGKQAGKILRLEPVAPTTGSLGDFMGARRDLAGTRFSLRSLEPAAVDLAMPLG